MIEVWSDNARSALEQVRNMSGVHGVSLYGDRLHITLENKMNAAEVVVQLRRADIEVKDFRDIQPSLEDVFISMVEKKSP
jgi:ABC-type uncharacterized transport system ATPase subunit